MKNRKTDWKAVNKFWSQNDRTFQDDINQSMNIMKEMENGGAEKILESTMVKWNKIVNKGEK